jgi:hypothetical protein
MGASNHRTGGTGGVSLVNEFLHAISPHGTNHTFLWYVYSNVIQVPHRRKVVMSQISVRDTIIKVTIVFVEIPSSPNH